MRNERQTRFGIGEWYGRTFTELSDTERKFYANLQTLPASNRSKQPCLPRSGKPGENRFVPCNKNSGVCSIRQYDLTIESGDVSVADGQAGTLRTTCPYRFLEHDMIFEWIGETMLGTSDPMVAQEIGFLEREPSVVSGEMQDPSREDVGRIDHVLVHPSQSPMAWCALEIQAVYFSGKGMDGDFQAISNHIGQGLPFPTGVRRPDYRSSGLKRLMPQLQIKVPSLRRWGKKMAVLVDADFFASLGRMDDVPHVSNCDIAWFVVSYDDLDGDARLVQDHVQFTTLERAVEGLTAGRPVSLELFETRLRSKLTRARASISL